MCISYLAQYLSWENGANFAMRISIMAFNVFIQIVCFSHYANVIPIMDYSYSSSVAAIKQGEPCTPLIKMKVKGEPSNSTWSCTESHTSFNLFGLARVNLREQ